MKSKGELADLSLVKGPNKRVDLVSHLVVDTPPPPYNFCRWCKQSAAIFKIIEYINFAVVFTGCECKSNNRAKVVVRDQQVFMLENRWGNIQDIKYDDSYVIYRYANNLIRHSFDDIANGQYTGSLIEAADYYKQSGKSPSSRTDSIRD